MFLLLLQIWYDTAAFVAAAVETVVAREIWWYFMEKRILF